MLIWIAVLINITNNTLNQCVHVNLAFIEGDDSLFWTIKCKSFTFRSRTNLGDVVETKHHVLRRNSDRLTTGRRQNIVRLKHQKLSFKDSLVGEGKVNSHLVTVEVCIECRTCEWVQLDCLTFNHAGLECLNTQTVQCRCTVEKHWVSLHHVFEDVPNNRIATVYNLLGRLHSLHDTALDELTDDERLVKFSSHQLWQTAFTHVELRTHDNNGTCRVVNTFTEKVLTETSLLTLEGIGERLQRTVALTLHGTALARVVEERVNGFLKHALLVAENDIRSLDFNESLQTVVTYDDTTIEVVQIGCGETSTIQWHKRTEIRRSHRDVVHNHPLWTALALACTEGLNHL